MLTAILRRSARISVGVIAAGMLVGLASPAVAATTVAPTANAALLPASPHENRKERIRDHKAFALINQERAKAGCAPLRKVEKLQTAAREQSDVQARRDRMGHDGANGNSPNDRLGGMGYHQWAENVAQYGSAEAAVNAWMNSPGHRANILNCAYTETGLDSERSKTDGQIYWTQTFGG
ncbi:CAP domain-containing protein [Pseudonocardia halophobica]|uniref:CAP domain-containing protein n=1 Tax=Pseudonocardia halophobica TaxID=29401 RepID=UPI003D8C677E